MHGSIITIHIASEEGGELQPLDSAELVAGCGIRGDRHFSADGSGADGALTLIEAEQVDLFNELTGLSLAPHDTRRQIVTRGVATGARKRNVSTTWMKSSNTTRRGVSGCAYRCFSISTNDRAVSRKAA